MAKRHILIIYPIIGHKIVLYIGNKRKQQWRKQAICFVPLEFAKPANLLSANTRNSNLDFFTKFPAHERRVLW